MNIHLRPGSLHCGFVFNSIVVEDRTIAVENFMARRDNNERLVSQSIATVTLFRMSGHRQRAGGRLCMPLYDGSNTFGSLKMLLEDFRR